MPNDPENGLKDSAVILFSEIQKRHDRSVDSSSPRSKGKIIIDPEEIRRKREKATVHGKEEIAQFKQIVNELRAKLDDMALFEGLGEQMQYILIDMILDTYIEPLFNGHKPLGMSDSSFNVSRAGIYKALINKYVNSKNKEDF